MPKRLVFALVCAGLLASCGPTSSPSAPASDHLQITAELTLDGQRLSQTWTLPAVLQTSTSGPGDLAVAMNPLWAPMTIGEQRTTSASLRPALDNRRQVLLLRLPSGEGIGIDVRSVSLKAGTNLEQTTHAAHLYFFDSADHPTKLIEQPLENGLTTPCPDGLSATNCSALITVKRVESGASSALSVRTLVFASMDTIEWPLPDAQSSPERARLVWNIDGPTIVAVEGPAWQSVRSQAIGRTRPHSLVYSGGTVWTLAAPASTSAENRRRQYTRYLTPLSAQDIRCCGSTFDAFAAGTQRKITGQIEYKGRSLTYQSWQESDRKPSPAIVDPAANVAIVLQPVRAKLIDLVTLR